ncbi:MAG: PAS domain S-box protein [Chloroflexi bacterium]|nr:PAS domain S-box protein [Chloroflexota bacterium]
MAELSNADGPLPQSLHEAVLETTIDGIISIDEQGVILSFNRAASAMFGYARDEVVGCNVSILMGEPERSEHDSYLSRYQRTGEARIIGIGRDVQGRRKDGTTFPLNLAVSQAADGDGNTIYAGILRDLSAKLETDRSAHQREERYRALVQNAPIGIAISDEQRRIYEANDALALMLGIPQSQIIGKRLSDFERDRSKRSGGGGFGRLLTGDIERSDIEREFVRPDGTVVFAHTTTVAVRDENGAFAYAFRLVQDVTEERVARDGLAKAREQYSVVVETMSDSVSIIQDGKRAFVNPQFVTMFGYRDEDDALSSAPFSSLVPEDCQMQTAGQSHLDAPPIVVRHRRQDGSIALIEQKLTGIVYRGRPAVLTVNRDVTAEVESRAALIASEERFRSLFDSAPIGIALLDADRNVTLVNQTLREMLGRTDDEMRGYDVQKFTSPAQPRRQEGLFASVVDGSIRFMVHDRPMSRAGGSTVWTHQTTSRVADDQGGFAFAIRTVTDISDLKRTEDALRGSQDDLMRLSEQSESIIKAAAEGILALDVQGRIISINPAAARLLAVSAENAIGKRARDLTNLVRADGTRYPEGQNMVSLVLSDGKQRESVDERFERPDGSTLDIERVVSALHDRQGAKTTGAVEVIRDVTERKRIERAKSEFLAMTSHELRTPLTAIHAAVGLSASGALGELPVPVKEQLEIASANSHRLISLFNDIVTLEQFGLGAVRLDVLPMQIRAVLEEAVELVTPLAAEGDVRIAMESPQVTVECDAVRIQQVLTNLLGNALKYAPAESIVMVSVTVDGREVTISVSDRGPGIDPNQAPLIFEQFQQAEQSSTRPHQGSGLGLAIAKAIVEQHYGRIWLESELGVGSTFSFTLPIKQAH